MNFELILDEIIGPREILHVMECEICGYNLIYFQHPITKKQIGFTCKGCNYVKKFDLVE